MLCVYSEGFLSLLLRCSTLLCFCFLLSLREGRRDPLSSFFILSCMRFVYITFWAARCSDFIHLIVYTLFCAVLPLTSVDARFPLSLTPCAFDHWRYCCSTRKSVSSDCECFSDESIRYSIECFKGLSVNCRMFCYASQTATPLLTSHSSHVDRWTSPRVPQAIRHTGSPELPSFSTFSRIIYEPLMPDQRDAMPRLEPPLSGIPRFLRLLRAQPRAKCERRSMSRPCPLVSFRPSLSRA